MSEWLPIDSAPKDGTPFLAWHVDTVDEYDENDQIIARGQKESRHVIAYYWGDTIVEYPWRGAIITNRQYTHWMSLPEPPK